MRYTFPPYDFIIIGFLTLSIGFFIRKIFFKKETFLKVYVLVPYAIAFLCVSILFFLLMGELPLKLYPYRDFVYDPQSQMGPNPQGLSVGALIFLIQYFLSIVLNIFLLGYALFVLIRFSLSFKREKQTE